MSYEQVELTRFAMEDVESVDDEHMASKRTTSIFNIRWTIVAAVIVVVAFVGVVCRASWTHTVLPIADVDAAIGLETDDWKKIICPVVGAMFKAGDLRLGPDGLVGRESIFQAMLRAGFSEELALATSTANFEHLPSPQRIDIFTMDLNMERLGDNETVDEFANDTTKKNREHDKSTGIRDGHAPDEEKYEEFEQFINSDGDGDSWSLSDIEAAIEFYEHNFNDFHEDGTEDGLQSIKDMFTAFADDDSKISKAEMKSLYLDSDYTEAFKKHREELLNE